jgi:hypothetical protein
MSPDEPTPPPHIVAQIHLNRAIMMGHQENVEWVDLYQFVILPQTDGTSRLILLTRTMLVGGIWPLFHPGTLIMECGRMLQGIKERAQNLALSGYVPAEMEVAPAPEVFTRSILHPPPPAAICR